MRKTVIGVYHKDCIDGTTAAAVLLKKFPNVLLFELSHLYTDEDLTSVRKAAVEGSDVYIVDCMLGLKELLEDGHKVTVIDHHIGVKDLMDKLVAKNDAVTYIFDNNKSGSSLAWNHFFPEESEPEIIKYVEDSDIWRLKYGDDTKNINNYLYMYTGSPDYTKELFDKNLNDIKEKGKIISKYSDFEIKKFIGNAESINLRIGKYLVPAYNSTVYVSDLGNKLSGLNGKAVVIFKILGHKIRFSFRSINGQSPSALELAKILGGAGHKNAAGAKVALKDFLKML
ncbi:MAG: DHHA1 domain-containing protein [Candidatus Pacebacteria bacterium]|jgi:oligoribonuclease NrnB/cAMP/cGMP phosphodiesterase (DHH superfamily)|nr:DHHA1 domain-containing protein [Candidatus Paceibacterota bacterium]|tara:strand:+ start:60267 stop:61118 length:852 start_codon:yes stop_codon:yes gene_type:complete